MHKLILITFFLTGSLMCVSAQKSKVIGVFQLIEKEKFEEAKGIIEDATKRKSTLNWSKTWYARGVLCQNAYRKGIKKNDKNLYELYPDQLYVAYSSFERVRHNTNRVRYEKLLPSRYVLLANDLMELGTKHYNSEEYDEAFKAFDFALRINKSNIPDTKLDTSLLYNVTLCAYKSGKWNEAIRYLNELNEFNYSSNIPHLLFSSYMSQNDTVSAQKALIEGIEKYDKIENLVLLLVDLLFKRDAPEHARKVLNDAFRKDSANYIYPYTKGLLYQKTELYQDALEAYKLALTVPSDTVKVYTAIGSCYYNMGAEVEEKARTISNNSLYQKTKQESVDAFVSATTWFEKAFELNENNKEIINKLSLLYKSLGKKEKLLELNIDTH